VLLRVHLSEGKLLSWRGGGRGRGWRGRVAEVVGAAPRAGLKC